MTDIRIKKRDDFSIEFKTRYLLRGSDRRKDGYDFILYLFLPYSFNIHGDTFEKNEFYEDFKLYLRFNTPSFRPEELLDPSSENSPLRRLEDMASRCREGGSPVSPEELIYETKLLGCVYKSMLRDCLFRSRPRPLSGGTEGRAGDPGCRVGRLHRVVLRYHAFYRRAQRALPESLAGHCRLMDEYLSLLLEKQLIAYLTHHRHSSREAFRREIQAIIRSEIRYRKKLGYPSVLEQAGDEKTKEEYIYRQKMLKRYSSQVLFFDVRKSRQAQQVEHLLYALAAGISMIFATAVLFFGQTRYGALTGPLFVLLVVSYMLKDRIKEVFRDLFRHSLGAWLFDRAEKFYDPLRRRRLAVVKERIFFARAHKVDRRILQLRDQGSFEKLVTPTSPEEILVYHKRVRLDGRVLAHVRRRISGLADIGILDLQDLLRHLSRQRGRVPRLDGTDGIQIEPVQRTYHLNIILHYRDGEREEMEKLRLIVDAGGIKRIERIEPARGRAAPAAPAAPVPGAVLPSRKQPAPGQRAKTSQPRRPPSSRPTTRAGPG